MSGWRDAIERLRSSWRSLTTDLGSPTVVRSERPKPRVPLHPESPAPRGPPADPDTWTGHLDLLADVLDAAFPELHVAWRTRPDTMVLESLPTGALDHVGGLDHVGALDHVGDLDHGHPEPLRVMVARHRIPILYVCINQLVVQLGDEAFLPHPPGDDATLPARRWPDLAAEGGAARRLLRRGAHDDRAERLAAAREAGLFESVELAPRIHARLLHLWQGPAPQGPAREQILALLFVLRYWEDSNSDEGRLPQIWRDYEQVPPHVREDLERPAQGDPPDEPLTFEPEDVGPEGGEVRCYPGRLSTAREAAHDPRWWCQGYALQPRTHDTQVGGLTMRLWHVALAVSPQGWQLERTLLWQRRDEGIEMS